MEVVPLKIIQIPLYLPILIEETRGFSKENNTLAFWQFKEPTTIIMKTYHIRAHLSHLLDLFVFPQSLHHSSHRHTNNNPLIHDIVCCDMNHQPHTGGCTVRPNPVVASLMTVLGDMDLKHKKRTDFIYINLWEVLMNYDSKTSIFERLKNILETVWLLFSLLYPIFIHLKPLRTEAHQLFHWPNAFFQWCNMDRLVPQKLSVWVSVVYLLQAVPRNLLNSQ